MAESVNLYMDSEIKKGYVQEAKRYNLTFSQYIRVVWRWKTDSEIQKRRLEIVDEERKK